MELKFQAIVKTVSNEAKTKSNNGTYAITTVEFIDGPAKGKVAFANRTLTNAEGAVKSAVEVGQEVTVHGTALVNRETGKPMIMWEVQAGVSVTDADTLNGLFGLSEAVEAPEVKLAVN